MLDRFVQALARLALSIFFRRLEVEGKERFPLAGPTVVVANHVNSLLDAVMLAGVLPRMPRFLAKSTLWQNPGLRPFLALARAIPVYRRIDPGVDAAQNFETFARCHEVLRDQGLIAIFPEGISHNEPQLQPLKTGAARITLEAESRFGPLGVRIVPMGLTFDAKGTFRSRALVRFGDAIEPGPTGDDPWATVQALTARIEAGLKGITLNFESWDEARRLERAVELFDQPIPAGSEELAWRDDLRRAFLAGSRRLRLAWPDEVAAVEAAVDDYDRLLRTTRLTDDQVAAQAPAGTVLWAAWSSVFHLLLRLPLGLVGTLLNYLPYRLAGVTGRRFGTSPDTLSTYKLFPALVLFPVTWALEALALGLATNGWMGLGLFLFAPLSGWIALRFHERRASFFREARGHLTLRTRTRIGRELVARRQKVVAGVRALIDRHRELEPAAG